MYAVYLGGCAGSRKNGIREADLRYEVAEVRSPYLEVSFCDLNTQTVEQTVVEVNPFYRFLIFSVRYWILTKRDMKRQGKSLWIQSFIIWH